MLKLEHNVILPDKLKIDHTLYLRLLDQAHAVATYHQYLIDNDLAPGDDGDDRSALECGADHVATLAGYEGAEREHVADALWRGLRDMTNQAAGHALRNVVQSLKSKTDATIQKYHAQCATCGYVGRSFASEADAETDGDEHEIAVGDNRQHHHTRTVSES